LLIVVNFQSWLDPFIMIPRLPAALAGIAWFLFITHTTLSVPALMGAIIAWRCNLQQHLVVSFATEKMQDGSDSISAHWRQASALSAVLMTVCHDHRMVPCWTRDGGTKGLLAGRYWRPDFATVSTLFFVQHFQRFGRVAGIRLSWKRA